MKKIIILLALVILGIVGYVLFSQQNKEPVVKEEVMNNSSPTPQPSYTLTQVAEHGAKDNCWIAVEGKVYDVTPFVKSGLHPGKEAILAGCGKDATELFNTRPMGTGTPHSAQARKMITKYYIGELTK